MACSPRTPRPDVASELFILGLSLGQDMKSHDVIGFRLAADFFPGCPHNRFLSVISALSTNFIAFNRISPDLN